MSNISVIETLSHTLGESDLSDAISILVAARNKRQKTRLNVMKSSLCEGDSVTFYHSQRGTWIRGTIKKVKTKKALVIEEGQPHGSPTWDVPMGMITKI